MKHILITGATSGIGAAVVASLIDPQRECRVGIVGRNDCDFNDADAVMRVVVECARIHGPLDGVFHAAGAERVAPLRLSTQRDWHDCMACATSAYGILRAVAAKGVMNTGGSVVLMSSVAAHRGVPGMAAYSAGKAAVEALARSAAVELASRGIRVNAIAAGAVRTPMHERITGKMPQAAQDAYVAAHPLGFGTVDAVREAALHLLGNDSRWTTGTTMVVDGGYLAK